LTAIAFVLGKAMPEPNARAIAEVNDENGLAQLVKQRAQDSDSDSASHEDDHDEEEEEEDDGKTI
jgi:hypothetical protein